MTKEEKRAKATARMREWRARNKERDRRNQRSWRSQPEVKARLRDRRRARGYPSLAPDDLAYHKSYYQRNKERQRDQTFRRKFGITLDQYNQMLEAQGGVCAICRGTETMPHQARLSVDHCHTTGAVRGLLCSHCNRGIGCYADDPARLEKAACYLREHK